MNPLVEILAVSRAGISHETATSTLSLAVDNSPPRSHYPRVVVSSRSILNAADIACRRVVICRRNGLRKCIAARTPNVPRKQIMSRSKEKAFLFVRKISIRRVTVSRLASGARARCAFAPDEASPWRREVYCVSLCLSLAKEFRVEKPRPAAGYFNLPKLSPSAASGSSSLATDKTFGSNFRRITIAQ